MSKKLQKSYNNPWYNYIENGKILWKEPSFYLVWIYYLMNNGSSNIIQKILRFIFTPIYYTLSIILGINIPRTTKIGEGLRIYHYSCIVINSNSVIGQNCKIRQGVTIGNKKYNNDCPTIGNDCNIGAGAKILGKINIGNNVTIGANAVVITDIPDNCIAVGIPAIIKHKHT